MLVSGVVTIVRKRARRSECAKHQHDDGTAGKGHGWLLSWKKFPQGRDAVHPARDRKPPLKSNALAERRSSASKALARLLLFTVGCAGPGGTDNSAEGSGPDVGETETSDAGIRDAGPADGGLVRTSIDCDGADAKTRWCDEICEPYDVDLGWAPRVHWWGWSGRAPRMSQCIVGGDGAKANVLWRAPWSGRWVVDNFGSDGSWFRGVGDARCNAAAPLSCDHYGWASSVVLDLEEGAALVAEGEVVIGENGGARLHRFNIAPWTPEEAGPDCLDLSDNDGDGKADCADPDCQQSEECTTPRCADATLPSQVPLRVEGELTPDYPNRYGRCAGAGREIVLAWQAPRAGRFVADANKTKFMGVLSVRKDSCVGAEQAAGHCPRYEPYPNGFNSVSTGFDAIAGEWVYLMVGGIGDNAAFYSSEHYVLEIRDWEDEGGANCRDGLDNDGDGWYDVSDDGCQRE